MTQTAEARSQQIFSSFAPPKTDGVVRFGSFFSDFLWLHWFAKTTPIPSKCKREIVIIATYDLMYNYYTAKQCKTTK